MSPLKSSANFGLPPAASSTKFWVAPSWVKSAARFAPSGARSSLPASALARSSASSRVILTSSLMSGSACGKKRHANTADAIEIATKAIQNALLRVISVMALAIARQRSVDRLDQILDHFFCVAEHHHRLVHVEERIVESGVAGRHGTLVDDDRLGLVRLDDRHAVDR